MSLARFFDRTYAAAGKALSVSRVSLEDALGAHVIGIVCGDACEDDDNARWTAALTVNLLSRMYPELAISGSSSIVSELTTLAQSINPSIAIRDSLGSATFSVCVGSVGAPPPRSFFAGATGWVAHVQEGSAPPVGPANPYAAAAAACLAVARVFREVFAERLAHHLPERDTHVSLLDYNSAAGADCELSDLDLGDVAVFGLGAVGNGALWPLARHPQLMGRLLLVDPEQVELSNLQRYVLTTDEDVARAKTDVAHDALRSSNLRIEDRRMSLEDFANEFPDGFTVPTVLVSVDHVEGRRTTQALLPKLVLNGWTGEGALGASWHVLSDDAACLACLYQPTRPLPSQTELVASALGLPPERAALLWVTHVPPSAAELSAIAAHLGVPAEVAESWRGRPLNELYRDVVCGTVSLDVRGIGRVETVPLAHQSAMAGVLAATEMLKRIDPTLRSRAQPGRLVVWDDVLRPPPTHWAQPRTRVRGCICTDADYQQAFAAKWRTLRA